MDLSIAQVEEQQSQNAKAKNATAEASAANWTCSESMVVEANSFVSFADQKLFTIPVDSPIERRSSADALRILEGASENGEDDDIDDLLKYRRVLYVLFERLILLLGKGSHPRPQLACELQQVYRDST